MNPDIVNRFGYLSVGVSNLDEGCEFYSRFVRLEQTERVGDTAFMTGGPEHHWVRLEEGSGQGLKRIGYEVTDDSSFALARARLRDWGIDYTEGGDPKKDRVARWLRFVDPGGFEIELFSGMWERGVAPVNSGVTLEKFLHAGWEVTDWDTTTRFYQEVLGFKASDWIGDMAGFFRAGDRYHHSLVLIRAEQPSFNHFCIQVSSIDDVMRFRHNAARHGVEIRDDILRHAPSGSIGVYVKDVARGFAIEYCVGHPQVDDATHRPRTLPLAPETVDVWRAPLPEIRLPGARSAPSAAPSSAASSAGGASSGVPAAGSVPTDPPASPAAAAPVEQGRDMQGRDITALLETADRR
jgi:catechol 2,3-dioxygenase-like lactoylglutathione lyase family enzyme